MLQLCIYMTCRNNRTCQRMSLRLKFLWVSLAIAAIQSVLAHVNVSITNSISVQTDAL